MTQSSPYLNPYDVLEISPDASNKEITIAFTVAMKKRKYSPREIAIARKRLIDPQTRIIADYLRPIVAIAQPLKRQKFSQLNTPKPKLEFLEEFNNLEAAINQDDQVLQRKLGASLFPKSFESK